MADEATAANTVSQDPDASADVFLYANDNLTVLADAKALAKIGAVVGVLTFIILAIGSLLTYRNGKSYKEKGGF